LKLFTQLIQEMDLCSVLAYVSKNENSIASIDAKKFLARKLAKRIYSTENIGKFEQAPNYNQINKLIKEEQTSSAFKIMFVKTKYMKYREFPLQKFCIERSEEDQLNPSSFDQFKDNARFIANIHAFRCDHSVSSSVAKNDNYTYMKIKYNNKEYIFDLLSYGNDARFNRNLSKCMTWKERLGMVKYFGIDVELNRPVIEVEELDHLDLNHDDLFSTDDYKACLKALATGSGEKVQRRVYFRTNTLKSGSFFQDVLQMQDLKQKTNAIAAAANRLNATRKGHGRNVLAEYNDGEQTEEQDENDTVCKEPGCGCDSILKKTMLMPDEIEYFVQMKHKSTDGKNFVSNLPNYLSQQPSLPTRHPKTDETDESDFDESEEPIEEEDAEEEDGEYEAEDDECAWNGEIEDEREGEEEAN